MAKRYRWLVRVSDRGIMSCPLIDDCDPEEQREDRAWKWTSRFIRSEEHGMTGIGQDHTHCMKLIRENL